MSSPGIKTPGTDNENSSRKEWTESQSRKTVHQSQTSTVCLYLSWVLGHTLCSSPGFRQGCALIECCLHQLLTRRRQERHEEHLNGGRFEHSQQQASGLQQQFLQFAFLLPQHCALSAVSRDLQSPFFSLPSHTLPFMQPYLEAGTHTTAHKSFLPMEAFRFPSCSAPFHGFAVSVPTTTDQVLISQIPARS